MQILVLSDSHTTMGFMRLFVEKYQPDAIIHLGDYLDDGLQLKEEYPGIPMYQVSGNCDRYRDGASQPEIRIEQIGGVNFYLTHGHRHNVKSSLDALLRDARRCKVDAVLFGHTHSRYCSQESDGLWVMNPGSAAYDGGNGGIIEIANGKIQEIYWAELD